VLAETRWNRREAAGQLKISYKALLNKLKKWEVVDPCARRATPRTRVSSWTRRWRIWDRGHAG
jgi:hypothetical protein